MKQRKEILIFVFIVINFLFAESTGILGGGYSGTYIQFAKDIADVCTKNGASKMHVVLGGSLYNIKSLLNKRFAQFAIVQADALNYASLMGKNGDKSYKDVDENIRTIFPLYKEEIHLLVNKKSGINSIMDLRNKNVNVGSEGSGVWVTSNVIKAVLGIDWNNYNYSADESLKKLIQGDVDAMIYVVGQPWKTLAETDVKKFDKLKIVPITDSRLLNVYESTILKKEFYNFLDNDIPSISTRAILVTYNYKPSLTNPRFKYYIGNIENIINGIFNNLEWLQNNRHPKWKEVALSNVRNIKWELHYKAKEVIANLLNTDSTIKKDFSNKKSDKFIKKLLSETNNSAELIILSKKYYKSNCFNNNKLEQYYKTVMELEKKGKWNERLVYMKLMFIILHINYEHGDAEKTNIANLGAIANEIGNSFSGDNKFEIGLSYYEIGFKIFSDLKNSNGVSSSCFYIGESYLKQKKYKKAIAFFKKALDIDLNKLNDHRKIIGDLQKITFSYEELKDYKNTIYYLDSMIKQYKIVEDLKNIRNKKYKIAEICLRNLYLYDKALKYIKSVLNYDNSFKNENNIAKDFFIIAEIYNAWNKKDTALEYYIKSIKSYSKLKTKKTNDELTVLGECYYKAGIIDYSKRKYDESEKKLKKSLLLWRKVGASDLLLKLNGAFSRLYEELDKMDEYYKLFTKKSDTNLSGTYSFDIDNNKIKDNKVQVQFNTISKRLGLKLIKINEIDAKLRGYAILAKTFLKEDNYNKTIKYCNEAITYTEKIRKTAPDKIRINYLSKVVPLYKFLISAYLKNGQYLNAIITSEFVKARYLSEIMGGKKSIVNKANIKNLSNKISKKKLLVDFVINNNNNEISTILIDNNKISGIDRNYKETVDKIIMKNNLKTNSDFNNLKEKDLRGLKLKQAKKVDSFKSLNLYDIINYYKMLLSKREQTFNEKNIMKDISRNLYDLLFANIEAQIKDKKELTIIPDGILAFLPFETLIMPDGRYLIEKYHISYLQSLTVSEIINKRDYSKNRKPILAFGGAVYNEMTYQTDMKESQMKSAINRGQNTGKILHSIYDIEPWKYLPATLTEVNAIGTIINGANIYTGVDASEDKVKALSKNGDLKKYKVLHFATHGLVIPEKSELSSLILSLFKNKKNKEDGYLCLKEIAELDLNADFVNLSACETGLGKIYSGEGVVGLTQSFLIAGANGLSVSLWRINDESTMEFMVGVYKLVDEKGISYSRAMTEMKRNFLKGKYRAPFYWSPFVYYGK